MQRGIGRCFRTDLNVKRHTNYNAIASIIRETISNLSRVSLKRNLFIVSRCYSLKNLSINKNNRDKIKRINVCMTVGWRLVWSSSVQIIKSISVPDPPQNLWIIYELHSQNFTVNYCVAENIEDLKEIIIKQNKDSQTAAKNFWESLSLSFSLFFSFSLLFSSLSLFLFGWNETCRATDSRASMHN